MKRKLFGFLICVLVLGVAAWITRWELRTAKRVQRAKPVARVVPVRTLRARVTDAPVRVVAYGNVVAAERIALVPEVAGKIVAVSPRLAPGATFEKGELLAKIDPSDYRAQVAAAAAKLAEAEYQLRLEQGQQVVARREWELLRKSSHSADVDRDLVLRKPHLRRALAAVDAAKAALAKAKHDLERTELRAPFNCVVLEKFVDVGQWVGPQAQIATLAGTDRFWVRATLPVDELRWIAWPDRWGKGGALARVARVAQDDRAEVARTGRVVRVLADVSQAGRLAQVLVEVANPLARGRAADSAKQNSLPLLLGDYVRVEIVGRTMRNVVRLPRVALREGDVVWVMNARRRLEIRPVDVAWRTRDSVFVAAKGGQSRSVDNGRGTRKGIADGERVVVSKIATPLPGIELVDLGELKAARATSPRSARRSEGGRS